MKSASSMMILVLLLAAMGLFASRSMGRSEPEHREMADRLAKSARAQEQGACCNNCGICDRTGFARCQCLDLVTSCHPSCGLCEMTETPYWPPLYQCLDMDIDDCVTPCPKTAAAAAAADIPVKI